jgi:hypothetical protein
VQHGAGRARLSDPSPSLGFSSPAPLLSHACAGTQRAADHTMRIAKLALVVGVGLSPRLAAAGPITVGAMFGETQSQIESESGQGPDRTYGGFIRVAITPHVATQLEGVSIKSDPECTVTSATLLAVISGNSLGSLLNGRFVPIVVLGVGESWGTTSDVTNETDMLVHVVAGIGLEYRARIGLSLGVQARLGQRWMETQYPIYSAPYPPGAGGPFLPAYEGLWAGQFRSLLATAGWQF